MKMTEGLLNILTSPRGCDHVIIEARTKYRAIIEN